MPVAVLNDRGVAILHVDQLRDLLGLPAEAPTASYQETAAALNRVLEAVEVAILQVPVGQLAAPTPNRGRDIRELAYNIHYPVQLMAEALDSALFEWRTEADLSSSRRFATPAELASFCRGTRLRWWDRVKLVDEEHALALTETLKGAFSNRQILESQAWHAAQHLRQIYVFLREIGVEPARELTAADMAPIQLGETIF